MLSVESVLRKYQIIGQNNAIDVVTKPLQEIMKEETIIRVVKKYR